jgi:hypothetical protein
MSPEEREMLEKSLTLVEENHKMLRSLTRSMKWGRVMHMIYWALIIGSTVGAYYFVQPYIDQVIGAYGGAKNSLENVNSIFEKFKQ